MNLFVRVFLVLVLASVPLDVRAQTAEAIQHFDRANRLYRDGDYRAALDAYSRAAATGQVSGPLFYNMGNAYFRLDQVGQAIRYYEKARTLTPDQAELLHNLQIARQRTLDEFSQLPLPFWQRWWNAVVLGIGPGVLFGAGIFLYFVSAALLTYRFLSANRPRWMRPLLTASAAAGVVLIGAAFIASFDRAADWRAVVVADAANLRQAPQPDAETEFDIHEGLVLDVIEARDGWVQVRLPNGAVGWVVAEAIADV